MPRLDRHPAHCLRHSCEEREFVVKGYHLSLRKREAATIVVEAMEAPAQSAAA